MKFKNSPVLRWYLPLYRWVAASRLGQNDIDPRAIHTTLVVVLTTAILMWGYAFLAYYTIDSALPGLVGFTCSLIHLLSPLLYRYSNNAYLVGNVLLGAGMIHQGTFTYYTGGFMSNILIWYGILPLFGGIIGGRRGAITWFGFTLFISLTFFILHLNDYPFPHLISPLGEVWSQVMLVFGWIFLSSTVVIVYTGLREHTEKILHQQGQKIDDLFRVLFHDLANPLGRISIGLSIAQRNFPKDEPNRGLEIARLASDSMLEITQNIRKMYAVSKGKANVDLVKLPLNSAVDYITKIYAAELEKKKISIQYNFEKYSGINVLVEPVSFNNQVLGNVISNAIKFSPENSSITITAELTPEKLIKIEIRDNGIGIPPELINQLFDLNKKTTRQGTHGETGTGFGMHILKSFVEMYGGQVEIESTEGTTVRIFLRSS